MGWKGFIGGALSSAGKTGLDYLAKEDAQAHDMERMSKYAEIQKQIEIDREARIEAKAKTPGTVENLKLRSAEMEFGALQDSRGVSDFRSNGEGQMSNGDFIVKGGDGMVRRTDKDGNLKGSAIKLDDFERGMLSPEKRAEMRQKEATAERLEADAEYTRTLKGRVGTGAKADHYDDKAAQKAIEQHDKQLGTFYTSPNPDGVGKPVPNEALISRVQIVRDEMLGRGMNAQQAISFSRAFVNAAGKDKLSSMNEDQLLTSALSYYKKQSSTTQSDEPAAPSVEKPATKPAGIVEREIDRAKQNSDIAWRFKEQGRGTSKNMVFVPGVGKMTAVEYERRSGNSFMDLQEKPAP